VFEDIVYEHGGHVGSFVSGNTDYLVVGEKPGSKLAAAMAHGITILTEQEFMSLLETKGESDFSADNFLKEHSELRTCKWCQSTYQQWKNVPNYDTCPTCAIFAFPVCPHCNSQPLYVTDYKMYKCFTCGTWFEASYSAHVKVVNHVHIFKRTSVGIECIACGVKHRGTFTFRTKEEYDAIPEQVRRQREEDVRIREELRTHKRAEDWVASLSSEQIAELKEKLEHDTI